MIGCRYGEPEEHRMEKRTLDEKIREVILTVYQNAHLGDRDRLASWATKKLKEMCGSGEHA
jgi:hypothetical protein